LCTFDCLKYQELWSLSLRFILDLSLKSLTVITIIQQLIPLFGSVWRCTTTCLWCRSTGPGSWPTSSTYAWWVQYSSNAFSSYTVWVLINRTNSTVEIVDCSSSWLTVSWHSLNVREFDRLSSKSFDGLVKNHGMTFTGTGNFFFNIEGIVKINIIKMIVSV
jgi:hypothetical protein